MKELAVLNKYFIKYKWRFLLGIVFVALSNFFRVLQPRLIREALDLVIDNIKIFKIYEGFDLQSDLYFFIGTALLYFGGMVLLMALLMGIFMYFMRQTIIVMSRLMEYDIRKELFAHYENLSLAFYKKNNTGDLMSRITEDVSKVRMYLGPAVLYGINLTSLFVMVIISMLSVSVEMTLYSLIPLPFLSLSIYLVSNLINKKSEVIQIQLAKLNSISQEVYSGIRVVKSYVQEKQMDKFFDSECDNYKNKSLELAKVNALFFPVMLLLIGASTVITVYVGGVQVNKGNITAGNIAEFVIYVSMLTWPVTAIGWIASITQQAAASQKRINEFLNQKIDVENHSNERLSDIEGSIKFKDVHFQYPDSGIQALSGINFELKPGQKLAIVGKTGSGKTTIADLLVRMYNIDKGEILIDEKNINALNLADLRKKIGYVPQDVFLFSDTISANIAFGKRESSQKDIELFAKHSAVYEDIKSLTEGFETVTGERGVTLSGGQKQRVSIARALIKNPDIVILDDCLSAVDTTTEQKILGYLNGALSHKTTLIITHRIYASLKFDKIIVLEDGKVSEEGTHEELLSKKGFYFEMFEQQKLEEEKA